MKDKRKSNDASDSEDDIWEYKSVKRVRKKPGSDEVSKSSNIAQTKVTVKRRGKSSLTQNTTEDTDSNTIAFKTTSKNKRNKAASKAAGFPLGLENLEKWEGIFQSGKSQGILNRLEKSGKTTPNTGKLREFQKKIICYFSMIFKWTVYYLLKWIKFSVKKIKH